MRTLYFVLVLLLLLLSNVQSKKWLYLHFKLPFLFCQSQPFLAAGSKQSHKDHSAFQGKGTGKVESGKTCLEQGFCSKGYLGPKLCLLLFDMFCVVWSQRMYNRDDGTLLSCVHYPWIKPCVEGKKEHPHQTPGIRHPQPWAAVG